jgi:hypothetical protein
MEKYDVMRETGRKRTESLARRPAARVREAVASESFCALMLKYWGCQLHVLRRD